MVELPTHIQWMAALKCDLFTHNPDSVECPGSRADGGVPASSRRPPGTSAAILYPANREITREHRPI